MNQFYSSVLNRFQAKIPVKVCTGEIFIRKQMQRNIHLYDESIAKMCQQLQNLRQKNSAANIIKHAPLSVPRVTEILRILSSTSGKSIPNSIKSQIHV